MFQSYIKPNERLDGDQDLVDSVVFAENHPDLKEKIKATCGERVAPHFGGLRRQPGWSFNHVAHDGHFFIVRHG